MASNIYEDAEKIKFVLFKIIWNLDKFKIIEKKHILRVKFKLCNNKHLANEMLFAIVGSRIFITFNVP